MSERSENNDKGEYTAAVMFRDQEDMLQCQTLQRNDDAVHALIILPAEEGDIEPCKGTELDKVPGKKSNRIVQDNVHTFRGGSKAPCFRRNIGSGSAIKAQKDDATVIRVSAEKIYSPDNWAKMATKGAQSAREWAAALLTSEQQYQLSDSWDWEGNDANEDTPKRRHTVMREKWRIETSLLDTVLTMSGKLDDGYRYFIKPFSWAATRHGPVACAYKELQKKKDEKHVQWADRVYEGANALGVARGTQTLGLRCPRGESEKQERVRGWTISGVPTPQYRHAPIKELCDRAV